MASQIYESTALVSSFHAVNAVTGAVQEADDQGFISAKAGDSFVFESPNSNRKVNLNTLTFFTKDKGLKVQINDNEKYPIYVEPNFYKSVQYIRIYSFTVLEDCEFYYEGLTSE